MMTDQLALAKEGYEYLIDIFYQALEAAGGIKEDELVDSSSRKPDPETTKGWRTESGF